MNIFNNKPIQMLIHINYKYNTVSKVMRITNTTQKYTYNVIEFLQFNNLITSQYIGRERIITLTKKGIIIRNLLIKINNHSFKNKEVKLSL